MSIGTSLASARRKRRSITFMWMAALAILITALIYWEKTAILYILATLGLCALLAIVALADLGGPEKDGLEASSIDAPSALNERRT